MPPAWETPQYGRPVASFRRARSFSSACAPRLAEHFADLPWARRPSELSAARNSATYSVARRVHTFQDASFNTCEVHAVTKRCMLTLPPSATAILCIYRNDTKEETMSSAIILIAAIAEHSLVLLWSAMQPQPWRHRLR
jgi:hypothetical protein